MTHVRILGLERRTGHLPSPETGFSAAPAVLENVSSTCLQTRLRRRFLRSAGSRRKSCPWTRSGNLFGALGIATALTLSAAAPARGAEAVAELAKRLVALRGDVEALQDELDAAKETYEHRRRSLAAMEADAEMRARQAELQTQHLRDAVAKATAAAEVGRDQGETLLPVVLEAHGLLRQSVEQGPPFQRTERLAALDELKAALDAGRMGPAKGLERVWAFYEDELRLAAQNGMQQQVIELEGEQVLADVIHLGMVAAYFRAPKGRVGYATRVNGAWRFVAAEDAQDRGQVQALFAAFDKNVRTGLFELPGAIGAEVTP